MGAKTLIVVTGPTASGKTALAVKLAHEYGCDVISADSRQVYQRIPIVTAQPTEEEKEGVTHHLIGHLPLDSYYSAATFEEDALRLIECQFETSDHAIVCGGSMLYVDALCHGIDALPTIPADFRENLKKEAAEKGDEWLLMRLKDLDPDYYEKVDRQNIKRVFHAVEISLYGGRPYSSMLTGRKEQRPFKIEKKVIDIPRDQLFDRINRRVDRMVASGLEEEARAVYPLRGLNSLNTVGLKEMFAWFDGLMPRETTIERIKKNTRVFAKKQLTWLKKSDASQGPLNKF
ncbi:MAG: tRNA (adenosine(37)-N6)-dimethylallyltransferase MiaA [Muribaculaceae bacterium]|nr:tRNA (adenosine(37)-N6)-dimethylallyltransferase MiaA [Muribaculaceae bacterium]